MDNSSRRKLKFVGDKADNDPKNLFEGIMTSAESAGIEIRRKANAERRDAEVAEREEAIAKAEKRDLMKKRISATIGTRNRRPLATLAAKEAALHAQSAARAKLSNPRRIPDPTLLCNQLLGASGAIGNSHQEIEIRSEFVALYSALDSRDSVESMLDRVLVALNAATMDAFNRASRGGSRGREIELRYGMKGAQVLSDLIKLRDARRGEIKPNLIVGEVNVGAGAQAIVGPVTTATHIKLKPDGSKE